MLEMPNIHLTKVAEPPWAVRTQRAVNECFNMVFDGAQVMMHAVDSGFRIVRVNRCWLQRMGYKRAEVLGRRPTDFLTEELRALAANDVIPPIWREGSFHSFKTKFVRKDGQVLDVTLDVTMDAEFSPVIMGKYAAYAAIGDGDDPMQCQQAITTMRALRELTHVQQDIELTLLPNVSDRPEAHRREVERSSGHALGVGVAEEVAATLLERAENISISLRALVRLQEERLEAAEKQEHELLPIAKSIARNLTELANTVAEVGEKFE